MLVIIVAAMEDTNYYFDVQYPHLKGALDRFAQFFIHPLFTAAATDRELQAVNNEHMKNKQNDMWRMFQLLKSTSNPEHPMAFFGTGDRETLSTEPAKHGVNVRQRLIEFHDKFYSANTAKLAVIGRESLDDLQQFVESLFKDVPNKQRQIPSFTDDALDSQSFGKRYEIVPVKDLRSLSLMWQLPTVNPHYKRKPQSILSHLLGHEGSGSILSALKAKGWANSLSAGLSSQTSSFSIFDLHVDLTEDGLQHTDDIIRLIYQYLALLHAASDAKWNEIYQEVAAIAEMNFKFKSKENPSSYVSSLAGDMHVYDKHDVLSASYLYPEKDTALVKELLAMLRADKMRVHVVSQSFKGKSKHQETWYKTEYNVEDLPTKYVEELNSALKKPQATEELQLPKPNNFIATDFNLKFDSDKYKQLPIAERRLAPPQLLNTIHDALKAKVEHNQQHSKLSPIASSETDSLQLPSDLNVDVFWKPDTVHLKPKANVLMKIISPTAYSTPRNTVLTNLYCRLLDDNLNEFAYDADIAGLGYSLTPTTTGLHLMVKGYNHKLHELFSVIVDRMRNLKIIEERFELNREQLRRQLKNFKLEQPYSHALYSEMHSLEVGLVQNEEKLAVIDSITAADVQRHVDHTLFTDLSVTMLAHGNLHAQEAIQLAQIAEKSLKYAPLAQSQLPDQRVVRLAPKTLYYYPTAGFNPSDENSAVVISFQIAEDTIENAALASLLAHTASEHAFNVLRTQQQLGYLVFTGSHVTKGIVYFRCIVQSSDRAADYLDNRVEAWIEEFRELLDAMDGEEYEKNRQAVIARLLEKDKNLSAETNRLWGEINNNRYTFDRRQLQVEFLRSKQADRETLIKFFDEYIGLAGNRSKLSIQIYGHKFNLPTAYGESSSAKAVTESDKATATEEKQQEEEPADSKEESKETPPVKLRPAPVFKGPVQTITDFSFFKASMPLYPNYLHPGAAMQKL